MKGQIDFTSVVPAMCPTRKEKSKKVAAGGNPFMIRRNGFVGISASALEYWEKDSAAIACHFVEA